MIAQHVGNHEDFIEDDIIICHEPPCGFVVHIAPLAGDVLMRSLQFGDGFLPIGPIAPIRLLGTPRHLLLALLEAVVALAVIARIGHCFPLGRHQEGFQSR